MCKFFYWPNVSSFFSSHGILLCWRCQNSVWSLVISDYFHKTTNQLWTENSKMTGLKDCKSYQENVSLSLANRKLDRKMKGSSLINQGCGHVYFHIPHKSQKRLLFFGSLFRVWFYDSSYNQIKFSCSEDNGDVPGTY